MVFDHFEEAVSYEDLPEAKERVLQLPVRDTEEDAEIKALRRDWDEFVAPDLAMQFGKNVSTVLEDLKRMEKRRRDGEDEFELYIPIDHAPQWCTALNQARLILHERFDLPDQEEMNDNLDLAGGKWLALLQSEVYGVVMEFLIHQILFPRIDNDEMA